MSYYAIPPIFATGYNSAMDFDQLVRETRRLLQGDWPTIGRRRLAKRFGVSHSTARAALQVARKSIKPRCSECGCHAGVMCRSCYLTQSYAERGLSYEVLLKEYVQLKKQLEGLNG